VVQASQALATEFPGPPGPPGPVERLLVPVLVARLPVLVLAEWLLAQAQLVARVREEVSVPGLPSGPVPGLQPLAPPPWGPRLCART
jgi:hypothetical protein